MRDYRAVIGLIAVASGSVAAQAQEMSPVFAAAIVNGPSMMAWERGKNLAAGTDVICGETPENDEQRENLRAREQAGRCGGFRLQPLSLTAIDRSIASPSSAPASLLTYSPSQSRRRANLSGFVDKWSSADPRGKAAMRQLVQSTDVIAAIGAEMQPMGLRVDNVADAYTLWWVIAWHAAKGIDGTPNRDVMQAVKRQSAAALLATPQFATATDAQKQELVEAFLVQAALIDESNTQAQGKPKQQKLVAAAVRQGAKQSGIDLSTMTLTEEGFRPVRGSDASGAPVPVGDRPEALAAADETPKEGPNYHLLAAAGGAGFAGVYVLGKRAKRRG